MHEKQRGCLKAASLAERRGEEGLELGRAVGRRSMVRYLLSLRLQSNVQNAECKVNSASL